MSGRVGIIAGAGALWLAAVGSATAADIPVAPVYKAPVRVVAAQPWRGFYIGVHGGYGWGRSAVEATPDAVYAPLFALAGIPTSTSGDPKGFIGGITWGTNYQFDRIVIGTDSDFSFTDIKSSQTGTNTFGGVTFSAATDQKMKWFGTTKLRGGFLMTDNLLVYATGGLASGRVSSSAAGNVTGGCIVIGPCPFGSAEQDRWGWALGAGLEYASGPWQFRAEYLHYDLGTLSYAVFDPLRPGVITQSVKFNGDMVRGAITYRFDWTPFDLIFGRN